MAKSALIVGPPRSGTSLASSILAGLGYHVGAIAGVRDRLGDDHNPFGYFEADDVVERNADILRRSGYAFHNTWTRDPIDARAVTRLLELRPTESDRALVASYEERGPWLWKDPRLCFTLPYWWRLLNPKNTVVYLTTRDPHHAYASFRRKGWCKGGPAERRRVTRLVRQHAGAARRAVETMDLPYVAVDYADYAKRPREVADQLASALEVDVTPDDLNFHAELDHSGVRGRVSGCVRRALQRLPRGPVEHVARLMPAPVLGVLFPERVHSRSAREEGA